MNRIAGHLSKLSCQYKALFYFPLSGIVLLFLWFWRAETRHFPSFLIYTVAIILLLLLVVGTFALYFRCYYACYLHITVDGLLFSITESGKESFFLIPSEKIVSAAFRTEKDATTYIFTVKETKNTGYIFRRAFVAKEEDVFRIEFIQAFPHIEIIQE